MRFDGFDWDAGNREKCLKHGVSTAEIESLFAGTVLVRPDPAHSSQEERFRAVGKTGAGRHLFLTFCWRSSNGRHLIRPISARYMHAREVRSYEKDVAPSDQ